MFYYHESLNYWQRENPTYVPSRGGLGGGQAQHTQSISQRNSPLMSGNLSKYHLRHKQSVGNQSSQSEPLRHFSGCSLAGGGTLVLTISRWLLSLRLCLSHAFSRLDSSRRWTTSFSTFFLSHALFPSGICVLGKCRLALSKAIVL